MTINGIIYSSYFDIPPTLPPMYFLFPGNILCLQFFLEPSSTVYIFFLEYSRSQSSIKRVENLTIVWFV